MSVKGDIARLKQDADDLLIARMRGGDKAAARRLLDRETTEFLEDIWTLPHIYGAEVERVTASAPDDIGQAYRAAWALIPAMRAADAAGDHVRIAELKAQIGRDFDALPEWQGGRMWRILDDFYRASRPGFKLSDDDFLLIGDLLRDEFAADK